MPFEIGRVYNRRRDIHAVYNGQQRGGIVTPANHPVIFIFTGEEGHQHGYTDRWRADGVFEYFGQGQEGPMRMVSGNRAIVESWQSGKTILLFTIVDDGVRFEGEMLYERHHVERAPDTKGDMRDAIVFELRRIENVANAVDDFEPPQAEKLELEELRRLAFEAVRPTPERVPVLRSVFQRSRDVRDYVLARADGVCEGCNEPGPFTRPNGTLYLEAHHIRRLTDGGPDDPRHVIALCPTCHRRVHHGIRGDQYNVDLATRMKVIEAKAEQ